MKLRVEEAENRAKNIRLRNDWVEHQKKSLYQGELDSINRQLETYDAVQNKGRATKTTIRPKKYYSKYNLN